MTRLFTGVLYLPFAMAALILAADIFAVSIDKTPLRICVALLPAGLILLAPGIYAAIALALPVIYSAVIIGSGRFFTELWRLKNEAKLLLVLCCIMLGISLLGGYGSLFGEEYPLEPIYCSWGFLFITVMLVFIMLRSARAGSARSASWQAKNVLYFILPLLAAVPLGAFGAYCFIPVMKFIAIVLCAPLFAIIYLGNIACTSFYEFGKYMEEPMVDPTPVIDMETEVKEGGGVGRPIEFFRKATHVEISRETMLIIGLVLLGILFVLVTVLLIKKGRNASGEYKQQGGADAMEEEHAGRKKRRRSAKLKPDNAERVRYTYRQYLSFLRLHGIVPSQSRTSGDISEEARAVLRETDDLLRALYRKARYGGGEDVTGQDAELAYEAYLRLVNDDNLKPSEMKDERHI